MATLNLSTNGPSISKSYQSIVNAPSPSGPAASSPTYGQWALFSVSTPLVNAFQQGGSQESVLKVQTTGEGELIDLIEDFSDGRIQFGFVKVKDPNTGLPKHVLIAWCGEGVPERTKGYFTSHLAAVSKFLQGYHVQVTARSDRDLTPEIIVQKVADSSGSKYSGASTLPPSTSATKPPVASKPAFTPTRTAGSFKPLVGAQSTGNSSKDERVDEDGWGADAPQVTRTQLEKVPSAYQPTKVNMTELASQKSATTSGFNSNTSDTSRNDVVKGTYQPVGKVDLSEIRRKAQEAGDVGADNRPGPVKGAYEPVGKVDIASIRAKAQGTDYDPGSIADRPATSTAPERITTLPKPKISNKFGNSAAFTGTKAPLPGGFEAKPPPPPAPVGSASRTFADQGGKTPAQIWAEKKAKQQGAASPPSIQSAQTTGSQPKEESQQTGWKSSYAGKSWAPVQTTHSASGPVDARAAEPEEPEESHAANVDSIRDRFAHAAPMGATSPTPPLDTSTKPTATSNMPIRGGFPQHTEPEETQEDAYQPAPTLPQQPRSPSPESPARSTSPIRVAMPVGRGPVEDTTTNVPQAQHSIPSAPATTLPERDEPAVEPATTGLSSHGIRAIAQYDYEKGEDNEIDIQEGEYVTNIDMVDEDWWLGVNVRGEAGLFPRNYVEVVEEDEAGPAHPAAGTEPEQGGDFATTTTAAKDAGPTATALYDYEAAEDNEITFPEDAKIINVQFPDEDWWLGEYQGKVGLFPANYVELDA